MGLLYTLFKGNGNAVAKKEVLRNVYHVDLEADEMKEMDDMCNLSTGIYNHGRLDGREEGRVEEGKKIIIRLLQNHMSVEFIAENTYRPVEYIRQIAKEQNLSC